MEGGVSILTRFLSDAAQPILTNFIQNIQVIKRYRFKFNKRLSLKEFGKSLRRSSQLWRREKARQTVAYMTVGGCEKCYNGWSFAKLSESGSGFLSPANVCI